METVEEKRWEYDAVEVGQKGTPFTVEITNELISLYAQRVRNPNPAYREENETLVAMPTMVIAAAPLRRYDVAEANGFVALERVADSPRQTPFAKCEVRWHSPICAGDTITSVCSVIDKYVRRGSKFVTFPGRSPKPARRLGGRVRLYEYLRVRPGPETVCQRK